jgi:hypothetical protein
MPALCAPSRVVNNAEVGELRIRRTPTLPNGGATLDPEAGETEVHETGAAPQPADLGNDLVSDVGEGTGGHASGLIVRQR